MTTPATMVTEAVSPLFQRLALITGAEGLAALAKAHVTVFGLGGVGGWAAEALVRSGVGHVGIVDSDVVCVTNVNRQVQATMDTVGQTKTEALSARLLTINPRCNVTTETCVFNHSNLGHFAPDFAPDRYVVDAIDSLSSKLELIEAATAGGAFLVSCMGMAQKLDPTKIRVDPIWETCGCPLATLVRQGLRKRNFTATFPAVFSSEQLPRHADIPVSCTSGACLCPQGCDRINDWCAAKKIINGSSVMVTATAGMVLASLVVRKILLKSE
jgi:tRNA A37 threonylcarbamoyladenosine dehydratase